MNHHCPDEETLAAYFDGLMPAEEEAALHAELLSCPDCVRLVATLGLVLEVEPADAWQQARVPGAVTRRAVDLWPVEPSAVTQTLHLAARWLGERLAPLAEALAPTPLAAGVVRGGAQAAEDLHYEITLGELPLEIDLEVDGPEQVALTLRPTAPPPAGLLLRLSSAGETRALSTLDAGGTTLSALACGDYELTLERADETVGHLTLSLQSPDPNQPT